MSDEIRMTREEWLEVEDIKGHLAYLDQMDFLGRREAIATELDAALGEYMAALDDPSAKAAALKRFDAALVRLREVYREGDGDWEKYAADPQVFRL